MDATAQATVYLIHAWIHGIHPMLWRRFLVFSDSILADLHGGSRDHGLFNQRTAWSWFIHDGCRAEALARMIRPFPAS